MCRFIRTIALAGIALASTVSAAGPGSDPSLQQDTAVRAEAAAADGVLLLRGGGVLTGQIARDGDRYVVTRDNSEISVSASQVSLVAGSLEDAYQQQRHAIQHPMVGAHLRLAEWCLRNNLGPQAARELIDARGLDPRHPRLALLERHLAALAARSTEDAARPGGAGPAVSQAATSVEPTPREELDRLTELASSLPDGALEQFTRKVQPVLVNNCTASGCHQRGGGQPFQLDRAMLHGLSNRRSTLRNLAATLELVNKDLPQQSELLTSLRGPHGGMDGPVFGPRQEQLAAYLEDWVAVVTESEVAPDAVAVAGGPEPAQPSVYGRTLDRLVEPVRRVPYEVAEAQPATAVVATDGEIGGVVPAGHEVDPFAIRPARRLQYGAHLTTWQPTDPFDPEIFNRQTQRTDQAAMADPDATAPATR